MSTVVKRCDFKIDDVIQGRYVVQKVLGEGTFGKVYKVTDRQDPSKPVAFKLLKLWEVPPTIREELQQRFQMEFETGRIDSPYLVRSMDYGIEGGNPFFVMEFCPNGDISKFIPSSPVDVISDEKLCDIFSNVLLGLRMLHSCGKVHRDLKPENVLLKENDFAVLTDFGICGDRNNRMTERNILGKPMQMFGTYAYMPPEQLRRVRGNATVLPTTDIFSFGVLVYQLITGRLPFGSMEDQNQLVMYQKNATAGQWDRTQLNRYGVHPRWREIVEGCLVPDYKERFQSVDECLKCIPHAHHSYLQNVAASHHGNGRRLRVMQGEEYGKIYDLGNLLMSHGSMLSVGCRPENDIHIREEHTFVISRRHCTLETEDDGRTWYVRDGQWIADKREWCRSTNGTFLNSAEVTPDGLELSPGDILTIGDAKLRYETF